MRNTPERSLVLALVGTIEPHRDLTDNLTVNAVATRRAQYLRNFARAIDRRSSANDYAIVFAENSGASLEEFNDLARSHSNVEVLSCPSPETAVGLGRGYLETLLVRRLIEESPLVNEHTDPLILKQTGRYHLRNFNTILAHLDLTADLCINLRRYPKEWADMWFYAITRTGMRALAARSDVLREDRSGGLPSERALYHVASGLEAAGLRVQLRLPREPHFAGYRAMDGVSYTSLQQEVKWILRSASKRAIPRLWI